MLHAFFSSLDDTDKNIYISSTWTINGDNDTVRLAFCLNVFPNWNSIDVKSLISGVVVYITFIPAGRKKQTKCLRLRLHLDGFLWYEVGLRDSLYVSMPVLRWGILPCYRSSDLKFSVKILHLMIFNLVSQFLRTSDLICSEQLYQSIQLQSSRFCNPKLPTHLGFASAEKI